MSIDQDKDTLMYLNIANYTSLDKIRNVTPLTGKAPGVLTTGASLPSSTGGTDYSVLATGDRQKLLASAQSLMGTPYKFGAAEGQTRTVDCSSFTQWAYNTIGVKLPRTAAEQFAKGKDVTEAELKPGDLVLFKGTYGGASHVSHVGIYLSPGVMIHASSSKGVSIGNYKSPYFTKHLAGFKRFIQ